MKLKLELDAYQAVNLQWLLKQIREGDHERFGCLDTGDWCGEIEHMVDDGIEQCRRSHQNTREWVEQRPNVGSTVRPPDNESKGDE